MKDKPTFPLLLAYTHPKMPEGKCIWFSSKRGYGFVEDADTEQQLFVHQSNIEAEGFRTLRANQKVSFEIDENDGRPKAVSVQRIRRLE